MAGPAVNRRSVGQVMPAALSEGRNVVYFVRSGPRADVADSVVSVED